MRRACGISLGTLGGIICYFGYYCYIQAQYPGATVQRRGSIIQAMLLLDLGSLKLAYALGGRTTRCTIRFLCVAVRKNPNFGGLLLEQRRAVSYVQWFSVWLYISDAGVVIGTLCALQELHVSMMTTIDGRRQRPVCGQSPSIPRTS